MRADAERHGRGDPRRGAKNLNNLVNKRAESNCTGDVYKIDASEGMALVVTASNHSD